MDNFGDFVLSIPALAALIPGIVQVFKELLDWEGKRARALTMFVGMVFGGLFYAVDQQLIPVEAHRWIKLGVWTLACAPAAMGYYSLLWKPLQAFVDNTDPETRYNITNAGLQVLRKTVDPDTGDYLEVRE